MTHTKNFAEQRFINQEQEQKIEQIQETLSQFKQPIPDKFTELGQPKKYWGSTEDWKEPICERYGFKYDNNKSTTLDISKELSDKLKLTPKENFCVKEEVLSRPLEEGGITIKDEKEVFLRKIFTVENLENDIGKLFERIKDLEKLKEKDKELEDLKREKANLEATIQEKDEEISEKKRQVKHQEELIEEGTKIKEKLQKELEETKGKKRDWRSFYDYLNTNIVDKNEPSFIKNEWKGKYALLDNLPSQYFRCLFEILENTIGVRDKNLPIKNYNNNLSLGYSKILNPYRENEKFSDFYLWKEVGGFSKQIASEYDRILDSWKKDTPLQNING